MHQINNKYLFSYFISTRLIFFNDKLPHLKHKVRKGELMVNGYLFFLYITASYLKNKPDNPIFKKAKHLRCS